MRSTVPALVGLVVAMLLAPNLARAQTIPFSELGGQLKPGDRVTVVEPGGQHFSGRIEALTPSLLTMASGGGTRTFPETMVGRIVVNDSVRNGALTGLGVGVVPGVLLGWVMMQICENETGPCPEALFISGGIFGGLGAGVGAVIDGLIHRTITVSSQSRATLTLGPVMARRGGGIQASIRF